MMLLVVVASWIRSARLCLPLFSNNISNFDALTCIYVEHTEFDFCYIGHDSLNNLENSEDGAIVECMRHTFRTILMSTDTTVGMGFIVVACLAVDGVTFQ